MEVAIATGEFVLLALLITAAAVGALKAAMENEQEYGRRMAIPDYVCAFVLFVIAVSAAAVALAIPFGLFSTSNGKINTSEINQRPPSIHTSFKNSVYTINSANLYGDTDFGQTAGGLRVENRKHDRESGFLAGAFGEQPTHRIIFIGNQAQSAARFSEQGRTITGERVQGSNPPCFLAKVNVERISRLPVKNEAGHVLNRTFAHVREEKVERSATVANNTIGQHLRELSPEHPDEQVRAVGKLALLPVEVSLRFQQRKLFSGQVKALFHQENLPRSTARQCKRSEGHKEVRYCVTRVPVHTTTVAIQKKGLEVRC